MSAAAAIGRRVAAPPATTLESYRDDGPIARLLGVAGRRVPLPPAVLELVGGLPLLVLLVAHGDDASNGAVAAALAFFVVLAGLASGRPHRDRVRWAAPPVLRLVEYSATLYIGALAGRASEPAAFALLCALAFRHYDLVYRSRHQGLSPPAWVWALALGWDGRLILAWGLLALGALPGGYYVLAALFASVFVGESVASWRRFGSAEQPVGYEDDDEEDIAE